MALLDIPDISDHERFRSELASVQPDGRRKWIYARKPSGVYYRWRTFVSWALLAFFVLAAFVKISGNQFLLFDILERRFVLFGFPFWPEDFYLVAVLFLVGIVSLVLLTATLGRVWCGWMCPQTIFLEMIFRKIEWFIDGTPGTQIRRDRNGWSFERVWRFALKQSVFFAISFFIANLFLAYVISSDTLLLYIKQGPRPHIELFLSLAAFTIIFYLVFARFREQACLIVCPYGRFMSALVDEHTVTVTYDAVRGEQRSKWKKNDMRRQARTPGDGHDNVQSLGDCIDCYQCVTVCPTGIDIRDGIQLECVACTACIDACDYVMEKTGLQKGLIRYTSGAALQNGKATWLTSRVKAYFGIWVGVMGIAVTLLAMRSSLDVTVLRSPGTTWTTTANGGIANFYDLQIINKTPNDLPYSLKVLSPVGAMVTPLGLPTSVAKGAIMKGRFLITLPNATSAMRPLESKVDLTLAIQSGTQQMKKITTEFLTP